MKAIITGIQAETLTPFAYHSLMVQGGSSTLPELISDQAIMFGLAATLGMMHASVCLPPKGYREEYLLDELLCECRAALGAVSLRVADKRAKYR